MTNEEAKNWLNKLYARADITDAYGDMEDMQPYSEAVDIAIEALEQTRWIPVSERLPEDLEPVNITWVNHEPEPYYHDIKDRNFVATGIYYRGQWYWYSTTCADYLGEYGSNEIDKVDDAVEIIAWRELPQPYKGESEE